MPFAELRQMSVSGTPIFDAGGAEYNVKAYGAVGNGVADDTNAFLSANIAAQNGGKIFIPPGTYVLTKTIVPFSNQLWEGVPGASILQFNAPALVGSAGILFCQSDNISNFRTLTNVMFHNIVFKNTAVGSPAYGVFIGFSDHIPTRITIFDNEFDHCSANVSGGNYHNISMNYVHDAATDRGIGCTASNPGVTNFDNTGSIVWKNRIINCSNMAINGAVCLNLLIDGNTIIQPGMNGSAFCIDVNGARDTEITNNLINGFNGILYEQGFGSGGRVSARGNTFIGIGVASGTGIQVWPSAGTGPFYLSVEIADNQIGNCSQGVHIGQMAVADIHGNTYDAIGANAVIAQRTSGNYTKVTIHDETVLSFGQNAASQPAILTNSQNVFAYDNHIDGTGATTPIAFSGFAANGEIRGNTILNVTAANAYTGLTGAVKIEGNSIGNLPAVASITVTASPFTYTNADIYDEQVNVSGGTVSAIAVRGVTITNATSGNFILHPTDTITVTYTVAPTMFKVPM